MAKKSLFNFPQINIEDYNQCNVFLGQGSYGTVTLIENQKTKEKFALKSINYTEENQSIEREIDVMSSLQHPCLCPLAGFQVIPEYNSLYILLPYMENGSLDKIIKNSMLGKKKDWWDITTEMKALYGIAVGMAYMHSKGGIHRDLKPANVLLDKNYEVKITDFGTSRFFTQSESLRTFNVGTPSYMAPEMITNVKYDQKVDVYSYAITMYEVLLKKQAYFVKSPFKLLTLVSNGTRPSMHQSNFPYGDGIFNLIQKCWSPSSSVRPTFQEIVDLFPSILPHGVDLAKFQEYVNRINPSAAKDIPEKIDEPEQCDPTPTQPARKESTFDISEIDPIESTPNNEEGKKESKKSGKKHHKHKDEKRSRKSSHSSKSKPSIVSSIKCQAEMGNAKELFDYGLLLYCGDNEIKKDIPQAISFIQRAAEKENIDAIYWLGVHYFEGNDGIDFDMEKAREYIKKAADNKHPLAQFFYGFICERGNECFPPEIDPNQATPAQKKKYVWNVDKKEGFIYTKMAAEKGHATSALMIARKYESGIVTDKNSSFSLQKDEEMATKYYRMAADSGDVSSMIKFAKRADIGLGMKNDPTLAVRYMKLAADAGEMHGMYYYGFYVLHGKNGCKQNFKLAVDFIKRAADKGLPEARSLYANMLRTGFECVEKNEELAKKYDPPIPGH